MVMIASENDTMQLTEEGPEARDELNALLDPERSYGGGDRRR